MKGKADPAGIRLLLVDDEDRFREVVARRLQKRGLRPLQAASGDECLALLETTPMDVVVLDVKMPGLDGIETLKLIREQHRGTEVILLTGNAAVTDGIQGINAGAFDYLTKPIEIDHLANKILQAHEMMLLEREKKEEADYRQRLERKMIVTDRLASLGTLSTGIAHEINNPLAIINESAGFIRAVLTRPDMSQFPRLESLMSAVDKIDRSVARARKITHQLLGYVRRQEAEQSETDLCLLVEESLDLLKKEIQGKSVRVAFRESSAPVRIWTDPSQLRQVLLNLFTNAIHAVDADGVIEVDVTEKDGGAALVIRKMARFKLLFTANI